MPRKRVVSRTVLTTEAYCLMVNLKTKEQFKTSFTLCGHLTRDIINKRGDRLWTTNKEKFVTCTRAVHRSDFYAMPEEEFVRLARKVKRETKESKEKENEK